MNVEVSKKLRIKNALIIVHLFCCNEKWYSWKIGGDFVGKKDVENLQQILLQIRIMNRNESLLQLNQTVDWHNKKHKNGKQ